ncbi:NAD(P)-dependent dehydrogenase (short-subunit alcohol dehydrogenase family) [Evansella vedderi]|uniref:NAD(P)-dependent dehydrogenase (Short-subunit alcohol dehydrogenase family) n=1 Tax=Evansella vedderi TaxID=38282 RepID=A0ABU0A035_9BACI|nr:SDR family NAD(P)-dependent oxidoreductase [Evansella vedderi]MDQ0255700.1 NAD(P)-dependent dehydrogenase (short-subunit alcohol dehydrogenase family) [Evansella vedderi]
MNNRIVIITGANSGIGRAAATKFAEEGYHVIMACRNLEISREVQKQIVEVTKNEKVELMELDVSSFASIREFCSQFWNKFDKLDILIHNAAYLNHGEKVYQLSKDNIELTFATNTFGPYLMTNLMREHLAKSEDPRILHACTTNIRHFFDTKRKLELDNLHGEYKDSQPYNVYKRYGDSKMALLMLTFKFAEEFKEAGIQVNAIQIPAVKLSKETIKKLSPFFRVLAWMQHPFATSPESMANIYYEICTSDKFRNITGKLINEYGQIVKVSEYGTSFIEDIKQFKDKRVYPKYADNEEMKEIIWSLCKNLTCNKFEVKKIQH